MKEFFDFRLQTNLKYGIGASKGLASFLREKGFENVLILVDEGVSERSKYFNEVKQIIWDQVKEAKIYTLRGNEEPDYDYLDEIADKVRSIRRLDVIVGIGGGSCLDITKAAAVLKTNPGSGIEYRGFDKVANPGVPTIAIPTTAGTGSEVTINAVFTDKKDMKKLGINGRFINATYAILDAEWTLSCPESASVSAGMDAMTHALESFTCRQANPLTRIFSKEAFRLLYHNLPSLIDDPDDREKRQKLLLGSYMAGSALYNSGSGIAGALSYPIGVHYKVPHGIGGAVFLASVIEYNVDHGYSGYTELLDLAEPHASIIPREGGAERFTQLIRELSDKLKVPRYLNQWGIDRNSLHKVAELMTGLQAAFDQNPVAFSAGKDASEMLKKHVCIEN